MWRLCVVCFASFCTCVVPGMVSLESMSGGAVRCGLCVTLSVTFAGRGRQVRPPRT